MSYLIPLFRALDEAGVRYVVVGGVAVVLHGHARMTADLDLVVDLEPSAARRAVDVLTGEGFVPTSPEPAVNFADPEVRKIWIQEKRMQVFSMVDPSNPLRVVDLFVDPPIGFDQLFERSVIKNLGGAEIHVASISDLVRMKEVADRPQDRDDIRALVRLQQMKGS